MSNALSDLFGAIDKEDLVEGVSMAGGAILANYGYGFAWNWLFVGSATSKPIVPADMVSKLPEWALPVVRSVGAAAAGLAIAKYGPRMLGKVAGGKVAKSVSQGAMVGLFIVAVSGLLKEFAPGTAKSVGLGEYDDQFAGLGAGDDSELFNKFLGSAPMTFESVSGLSAAPTTYEAVNGLGEDSGNFAATLQ